jgi:hypothetical protein
VVKTARCFVIYPDGTSKDSYSGLTITCQERVTNLQTQKIEDEAQINLL